MLAPVFSQLEAEGDDSTISHLLHSGLADGGCRAREFVLPTLKVILLGGMQEPGHGAGSTLAGPARRARSAGGGPGRSGPAPGRGRGGPALGLAHRHPDPSGRCGHRTGRACGCSRGAAVGSLVSSANRDETKFADPDRFDIFRPRQVNIASRHGRHFCVGHAFSRALIRIALEHLLQRFPRLALDPDRPPRVPRLGVPRPWPVDVVL